MSNKFTNWLLGKQEPTSEKVKSGIDAEKALRNAIVDYFKQHFFGKKNFNDSVVVWIDNSRAAYQSYVRDKEFEQHLRTDLENKQLYAVGKAKFTFNTENPPEKLNLSPITDGVYIQCVTESMTPKAKITISNGKGSLLKDEYLLDSATQTKYNIGRGEGNYNHIVIKEGDPEHRENQYVSEQHAKIVFIAEKGFSLQPCDTERNTTIVYRNYAKVHDFPTMNPYLLQNNDEIELGRRVCLKFEIKGGYAIR